LPNRIASLLVASNGRHRNATSNRKQSGISQRLHRMFPGIPKRSARAYIPCRHYSFCWALNAVQQPISHCVSCSSADARRRQVLDGIHDVLAGNARTLTQILGMVLLQVSSHGGDGDRNPTKAKRSCAPGSQPTSARSRLPGIMSRCSLAAHGMIITDGCGDGAKRV